MKSQLSITLFALVLLALIIEGRTLHAQSDFAVKDTSDGGLALGVHGGVALLNTADRFDERINVHSTGYCYGGELKLLMKRKGPGLSFFLQFARFGVDDYLHTVIDSMGNTQSRSIPLTDYVTWFGGASLSIPFGDTSRMLRPFMRLGIGLGAAGGAETMDSADQEFARIKQIQHTGLPIGLLLGAGYDLSLGEHFALIGQLTLPMTIVLDAVGNDSGFQTAVPGLSLGVEVR